ncbi:esterase/lipase family protein [Streptomyces liangshanensis]|uniref:Alpha/beta fold hydrolase n=1 Tax=Streptomyces liangshanensis TaxID=2717324 RepID=A0A6G9H4Q5_9ACTN|nr:alpha/beta fold hydrolase [Streptomyces liangshanensis]QIQ05505.1 alpha/beta fold hydrolase [Streptomyces liangshanensis]
MLPSNDPDGRSWKRVPVLLAALLAALTIAVTPAAATTIDTPTRVTAAASPASAPASAASAAAVSRGWNNYSCKPSAAHPRPVVLVHGTFGNAVDNWLGLAPYLVDRGYCVFSLDYGQLPGVPLFYGLGPIDASAAQLATYVDKVLAATGAPKADLVGHSQGGMMPRHYLKFLGGAAKVNALVGIAPDNHGTTLLGLTRLLPYFPGAEALLSEATPGLADQVAGSAFLNRLNEGGDTVPGVRYTVIATRYDQVVTPYRSQFLTGPGVRNVLLQDLCPLDLSDHVAIGLLDRIAFHEVANALDPGRATPTTCASVIG